MAEDAAAAPVGEVAEEQQEEQPHQDAAPVEAGGAEAAVEEQAAAPDGALKRGREDEADGGDDGEQPDPKRQANDVDQQANSAPGEAGGDGQEAPAAEAAAAAPGGEGEAAAGVANGGGGEGEGANPGHGAAGAEEGASNPGNAEVQHHGTDNPGHGEGGDNPGGARAGPPAMREGLGTEAHEDGSVSEKVAVSKHLVGKLIGKAGATIQQLQATTATSIQVDQSENPEFPDSRVVTLRGPPERVAACKVEILGLLEEAMGPGDGENEETLSCPAGIVGRIIGRGGETIRALQQASGAHILVDQNYPEGEDRQVIIKGRGDSVGRAAAMIKELILGEPGSATAIIQKYSSGITLTLTCPKMMVGRVIGKGGEVIKGLQRRYHTSIQVEQGGDPTTITMSGPPGMVQACEREVKALVTDMMPPFGGPGGPRGGFPRGPPGYGPPFGGGPGPYGGPPGPYGAPFGAPFGAPYGAPYGAPPGGYGGYPAPYGAPAGSPYGGQPGAYGAGGYGAQPGAYGAAGGYPGGYGDPAAAAGGQAAGYGAAAAGAAGAAGGMGGPAGGGGGAVWQAMQDDQGRTYYYNTQTGVSQWEKPADMP